MNIKQLTRTKLDGYEMFKYNCHDDRHPACSAIMAYAEKSWLDIRIRGYM